MTFLLHGLTAWGRDHDATLNKVVRICRQANLKLNEDKCLFWCTSIPFFREVISWSGMSPNPKKVQVLVVMPPPKCKKELQLFLGIANYLSRFSLTIAEICKPRRSSHWWRKNSHGMACIRSYMTKPKTSGKIHAWKFSIKAPISGYRCLQCQPRVSLLQVGGGMKCRLDITPENTALHPIAFTR